MVIKRLTAKTGRHKDLIINSASLRLCIQIVISLYFYYGTTVKRREFDETLQPYIADRHAAGRALKERHLKGQS